MTTPQAEALYLAQHVARMIGRGYAVYNPHEKPAEELPVIYGFCEGGSPGWYSACLIAEDGTGLGGHLCSHEGYVPHDLGILEGSRPDRHETFREHYPDGYRMEFVPYDELAAHAAVNSAFERNKALAEADEAAA